MPQPGCATLEERVDDRLTGVAADTGSIEVLLHDRRDDAGKEAVDRLIATRDLLGVLMRDARSAPQARSVGAALGTCRAGSGVDLELTSACGTTK